MFLPSLESGWEWVQAVLCMATKFNPNQTFELLPLSTQFRVKTPYSFSCMMKWWLSDTLTTYTVTKRNVCETNREEACQWKAAFAVSCHTPLSLWNRSHWHLFACIFMKFYRWLHYLLKAEKGRGFSLSYWHTRLSLALSSKNIVIISERAGCALTVHSGLWIPEANPPLAFPSVGGLYVRPVDGTGPL